MWKRTWKSWVTVILGLVENDKISRAGWLARRTQHWPVEMSRMRLQLEQFEKLRNGPIVMGDNWLIVEIPHSRNSWLERLRHSERVASRQCT